MRIKNKQTIFGSFNTTLGYTFSVLSFTTLTALTVQFFAPIIKTNATEQTASQTVGPNTISVSSDDTISIDITPTSTQEIHSATNALNITNSCKHGATITLSTNSNSDTEAANNLIRTGTDDLAKTITPTTGDGLIDNSWGFSIDGGETFHAVPAKDKTPATIYNSSSATSEAETVNIKYGVKLDTNIPSGNYSNDVLYTVAVKPACLRYQISWNFDEGTANSNATYPTSLAYGETIALSSLAPTREGFSFSGWTNGSSDFTGSETAADLNPTNAESITMTANWTPYDIRDISNMQDMTSTLCNNTTVGTVVTLKDTRDDNTYTVKKLQDNRCWMTDNLRIDNKKITSADSNLPNGESFVISPSNVNSFDNGSTTAVHDGVYIYGSYGGYYSYYTATAGWFSTSTAANSVATKDICPKGWSLPTSGSDGTDFVTLYALYNTTDLLMGAPNFKMNGYVFGMKGYTTDVYYINSEGNYWTKNVSDYDQYIYAMYLNNKGTVETKHYAFSGGGVQIRCIAK